MFDFFMLATGSSRVATHNGEIDHKLETILKTGELVSKGIRKVAGFFLTTVVLSFTCLTMNHGNITVLNHYGRMQLKLMFLI